MWLLKSLVSSVRLVISCDSVVNGIVVVVVALVSDADRGSRCPDLNTYRCESLGGATVAEPACHGSQSSRGQIRRTQTMLYDWSVLG